ncbi:MAG: ADP-ribosylglycohydrolase family protein, partial [Oscillospiraceae bacterium]|nr:ADP-ribosylglycohydrolase family protein [Oscillospiraceae bacterium]
IRYLVEHKGELVLSAVRDAQAVIPEIFPGAEHLKEFNDIIQKAVDLADTELDDLDAIRKIGEGWVGDEALAIAIYCVLKHPDSFEDAIVAAVNHGGDSDSTGAIAGNIMGASLGLKSIPDKYLRNLELREVILEIADDLHRANHADGHGECVDPAWLSKYVRTDYRPT